MSLVPNISHIENYKHGEYKNYSTNRNVVSLGVNEDTQGFNIGDWVVQNQSGLKYASDGELAYGMIVSVRQGFSGHIYGIDTGKSVFIYNLVSSVSVGDYLVSDGKGGLKKATDIANAIVKGIDTTNNLMEIETGQFNIGVSSGK